MMLRMCVLQSLYHLSDEETEWQVTDRLSFRQFLGLGSGDRVPDARTLWLFKERLGAKAFFDAFLGQMRARGLRHHEGKIVDATIIEAPRQRNSREENKQIKAGQRPESFDQKAASGHRSLKIAQAVLGYWLRRNVLQILMQKCHLSRKKHQNDET